MPKVNSFLEAGNLVAQLIEVKKRRFLVDLWNDLVDNTPVCTGYARASWFISPVQPRKKNPNGKRDPEAYCRVQYPRPFSPNLTKYKRNYTRWFIVNLAPYIEDLNNGSSRQADAGWVNDIVARNISKVS